MLALGGNDFSESCAKRRVERSMGFNVLSQETKCLREGIFG